MRTHGSATFPTDIGTLENRSIGIFYSLLCSSKATRPSEPPSEEAGLPAQRRGCWMWPPWLFGSCWPHAYLLGCSWAADAPYTWFYKSEHRGIHQQVHPDLAEREAILPECSRRDHSSFRPTVEGGSVPRETHFLGGIFLVRIQKCVSDPSVEEASPEADRNFEVINGTTHCSPASAAKPPRVT